MRAIAIFQVVVFPELPDLVFQLGDDLLILQRFSCGNCTNGGLSYTLMAIVLLE